MTPEELAQQYRRVVPYRAAKWVGSFPADDLISIGNEALWRAALAWPGKDCLGFVNFAARYIETAYLEQTRRERTWGRRIQDAAKVTPPFDPDGGTETVDHKLMAIALWQSFTKLAPDELDLVLSVYMQGTSVRAFCEMRGISGWDYSEIRTRAMRRLRRILSATHRKSA